MFFPMIPLALSVTIESLFTRVALRQVVAVLAALKAMLDRDPHGLFVGFFLSSPDAVGVRRCAGR